MKLKLLFLFFLIFQFSFAQVYKQEVVNSKHNTANEMLENAFDWFYGNTRTKFIKKLKDEDTSKEENLVYWVNNTGMHNILIGNTLNHRIAVDIKYNIHLIIKDNKALITIKNIY